MGHFATGVTIVTTRSADARRTASPRTRSPRCRSIPPSASCASTGSRELRALLRLEGVHGEHPRPRAGRAVESLREVRGDKFTGVPTEPGHHGAPLIAGALATLECRITDTVDAGDHVIHVGLVERANATAATRCSSSRAAIATSPRLRRGATSRAEPIQRRRGPGRRDAARVHRRARRHRAGDRRAILLQILGENVAHRRPGQQQLLATRLHRRGAATRNCRLRSSAPCASNFRLTAPWNVS